MTGEAMEEEVTATSLEEFFPCACPCNCGKPSEQIRTNSAVLSRHARCYKCKYPNHRKKYPVQGKIEVDAPRTITFQTPLDSEERAIDVAIAEKQKREIYKNAWNKWRESLPEKFRDATTDHPKIIERMKRWRNGQPGTAGAVILGNFGEGKTFLAIGYANEAIKSGLVKPNEVLFGTEAELLASAANSAFSEVDKALRRLIDPRYKMIVVDDIGRGTWIRDDMRPKVFSLVFDAAWRDNRTIVITTNLTPDSLAEYIGEGAMDRLRSMVGYDAIDLSERGMRRKITQENIRKASGNN